MSDTIDFPCDERCFTYMLPDGLLLEVTGCVVVDFMKDCLLADRNGVCLDIEDWVLVTWGCGK